MKSGKTRLFAAFSAVVLTISGCGVQPQTAATEQTQAEADVADRNYDFTVDYSGVKKGNVTSGASVHDPSVLKANGKYYIYGSHMSCASCDDLKTWRFVADGYRKSNTVYGQIYDVYYEAFAYAGSPKSTIPTDNAKQGGEHVWAPDVIYNKAMGKYVMYYCTTSTWNASNLCYGISDSPEGPFEWQGALIYSGYDKETIKATDVLDYVARTMRLKHISKVTNTVSRISRTRSTRRCSMTRTAGCGWSMAPGAAASSCWSWTKRQER